MMLLRLHNQPRSRPRGVGRRAPPNLAIEGGKASASIVELSKCVRCHQVTNDAGLPIEFGSKLRSDPVDQPFYLLMMEP